MFEAQEKQEYCLNYKWRKNVKAARKRRGLFVSDQLRILANGGRIFEKGHRLEMKIRHIYPRGKAFFRMGYLLTNEQAVFTELTK
jgi:hypothetical protein